MGSLRRNQIQNLPDGFHSDGNNLYLRVKGNSRSWVYRYSFNHKVYEMGLGPAHLVSVEEARKKSVELGLARLNGSSPAEIRRESKSKSKLDKGMTVRTLAPKAFDWWKRTKKIKASTAYQYEHALANSPILDVPISSLTTADVASAISRYADSRKFVVISALRIVFKYCMFIGGNADLRVLEWRGGLELHLEASPKGKHYKSAPWQDVPHIYAELEKVNTPQSRALRFTILHALRASETLSLQRQNVDFDSSIATVYDTKTSDEFKFPVVTQGVELLGDADKCFKTVKDTMLKFLKTIAPVTVHGFRASFSTWCADNRKDTEIREACLQHVLGNKVSAAYQRSDLMEHRRQLLQEWADYVTCSSSHE